MAGSDVIERSRYTRRTMSFISELKRRNVFKVAIAYLVASWLVIQLADILVPMLTLKDLKTLAKSRQVSTLVATTARKELELRIRKSGG